jgi:hypothetical protein
MCVRVAGPKLRGQGDQIADNPNKRVEYLVRAYIPYHMKQRILPISSKT